MCGSGHEDDRVAIVGAEKGPQSESKSGTGEGRERGLRETLRGILLG